MVSMRFIQRIATPNYTVYYALPDDRKGGVAIFTHPHCTVLQSFIDPRYRFVWLILKIEDEEFGVLDLYAPNDTTARMMLWQELRLQLPFRRWIFFGDFHSVEQPADSSGNSQLLKGSEADKFYRLNSWFIFVDTRNATDGLLGPAHTRYQHTATGIKWSILDWIYISLAGYWVLRIAAPAHQADFPYSDHFPVLVNFQFSETFDVLHGGFHTYFKADPFLLRDSSVQLHLQQLWQSLQQSSAWSLPAYLSSLEQQRQFLKHVHRDRTQHLTHLQQLEAELQRLHDQLDLSEEYSDRIRELQLHISKLHAWEHHRYYLYSRARHLREGQGYTRYSHRLFRKSRGCRHLEEQPAPRKIQEVVQLLPSNKAPEPASSPQ
ncbi:hypothetical protein R1sor_001038 [Riccia sorocarpa]|uniref:Endonuclease/exonuclease/phosphatase domain-containing protein n=1 Tax=Riccia sorocarpa TaxID=122646 RepID=A0ABD3GWI5_9MARC